MATFPMTQIEQPCCFARFVDVTSVTSTRREHSAGSPVVVQGKRSP